MKWAPEIKDGGGRGKEFLQIKMMTLKFERPFIFVFFNDS